MPSHVTNVVLESDFNHQFERDVDSTVATVRISLKNSGDVTWRRKIYNLPNGRWLQFPPEKIAPNQRGEFRIVVSNANGRGGTTGTVIYRKERRITAPITTVANTTAVIATNSIPRSISFSSNGSAGIGEPDLEGRRSPEIERTTNPINSNTTTTTTTTNAATVDTKSNMISSSISLGKQTLSTLLSPGVTNLAQRLKLRRTTTQEKLRKGAVTDESDDENIADNSVNDSAGTGSNRSSLRLDSSSDEVVVDGAIHSAPVTPHSTWRRQLPEVVVVWNSASNVPGASTYRIDLLNDDDERFRVERRALKEGRNAEVEFEVTEVARRVSSNECLHSNEWFDLSDQRLNITKCVCCGSFALEERRNYCGHCYSK
jgi:hypothetical protein